MAERWQQWMRFHIDRWKGSPHVQAMPAAARAGYLYLLSASWQTDECSLPEDEYDLRVLSGLTQAEWTEHQATIMRRFQKTPQETWRNEVLYREWADSRAVWEEGQRIKAERREKQRQFGAEGAKKRWGKDSQPHSQPIDPPIGLDSLTGTGTGTGTSTGTKKPKKPSRGKREEHDSDPRHLPIKEACKAYAQHMKVEFVWDGSDAKALDALLKASPDLSVDSVKVCLQHRARSPGTPHGERPRIWLPHIVRWQQGPLNQFNRTEESKVNQAAIGVHKRDATPEAEWDKPTEPVNYASGLDAANEFQERMKGLMNQDSWNTWIKPLKLLGLSASGKALYLQMPAPEFAFIVGKYGTQIESALPSGVELRLLGPKGSHATN